MKKIRKKENLIKYMLVSICLFLTGCGTIGLAQESTFESAFENKPEEEPVDIFTSEGTGVFLKSDGADMTVTLYMIERGEERTFSYSLATAVADKHGSAMIMQQMIPGDIVSVRYNNELEKLGSLQQSAESFVFPEMQKYRLDKKKGTVDIGSDTYSLSKDVKVFSDGRQIDISQVLKQDVLTFKGIHHEVTSILVDQGHGYLDLSNEEALLGGWIEVGQTVISTINEDMLITVPEGDYTVRVTSGEIEEIKQVTIERDKETMLNFGHIETEKPTSGKVTFSITPVNAFVYVDDVEIDPTYAIRLPFGIHKLTAKAAGYDTLSKYFEVTEDGLQVSMNLSEAEATETTEADEEDEKKAGDVYTVTVKGPAGAEVYVDNLYKGTAPVSFVKEPGEHVITLRRDGYKTRSHSVFIEDEEGDLTYSFADLEKEESDEEKKDDSKDDDDGKSSVSDNSVSDNKGDSTDKKDDEKPKKKKEEISVSVNALVLG
ncbi:MAG: PEGA domain-containing protein [Lachnospiraceae bacterium]|nr:PEGA domain-containing protein [Lachnospiraceae bacterium]